MKIRNAKNINKAFTLAEVLITLGIIGVAAAMTIPILVSNYQKTQTVTKLKKTYTTLANAINLSTVDNGPVTDWADTGDSLAFSNTYLTPYLKILKNCGGQTDNDCKFVYKYLNGSTFNELGGNWARFYLSDGTLLAVEAYNAEQKYIVIYVDINGQNKPNTLGKDIFVLTFSINTNDSRIKLGRLYAYGEFLNRDDIINATSYSGNCNSAQDGEYCAGVIILDGWKISSDYPW